MNRIKLRSTRRRRRRRPKSFSRRRRKKQEIKKLVSLVITFVLIAAFVMLFRFTSSTTHSVKDIIEPETTMFEKVDDSKSIASNADIEILEKETRGIFKTEYGNVVVTPEDGPLEEIVFEGIKIKDIEKVRATSVPIKKNAHQFNNVFAIDPTKADFESAEVKAVAIGNTLFKCKEWNFEEQICEGRWQKIKKIIPGEEYSFTLTPEDPGYGEGNQTINVLDRNDFLINTSETIMDNTSGVDLDIVINDFNVNVSFNQLVVFDHNDSSEQDDLRIDTTEDNSTSPTNTNEDRFSVDGTNLSFSNITISGVAEAEEIWKCVDWNFTTQECYGEWINIMNVTIGDDYNLTIAEADPGFLFGNRNSILKKLAQVKLQDKTGSKINVSNIIRSRAKGLIKKQSGWSNEIPAGYYNAEVTPSSQHVKKINFRKLMVDSDEIAVKLQDIIANITVPNGGETKAGFSIDTSNMTFTDAVVNATASGNILWKCANWDFEEQECYGTWERVMTLIPGQDYSFTITPEDPGYIEGELWGDIYSNRSWFMQNDSIKIIGTEFLNSSEMSFDIQSRNTGTSIAGYPINITTNSSGDFEYYWNTTLSTAAKIYDVVAIDNSDPSYNDTLKITLNEFTAVPFEKVKEDETYTAVITAVEESGSDLIVTFHHDAQTTQPITIRGNVEYTLTNTTSAQYEPVNLTISDWDNQYFRIIVGSSSDVVDFGTRENVTLSQLVEDSAGNNVSAAVEIVDDLISETQYNGTDTSATVEEGTYQVTITPDNHKIQSIVIEEADVYDNKTEFLKIEENVNVTGYSNLYSIDPTGLNFTNATVTVTATGTQLRKCTEWNFTTQSCSGKWAVFKRNLVPGQNYTFILTPGDPGYSEINVTSAYHLDENRTILSNILGEVEVQDNNWSEPIYHNEYVQATFDTNMTNGNVMNLFIRNNESSNTSVEIYEKEGSTILGSTGIISATTMYNIILSNMEGNSTEFDLKIVNQQNDSNTYLEFDYIHDAAWITPNNHSDPGNNWTNEANAYDYSTTTHATDTSGGSVTGWGSYIIFNLSDTIYCDKVRVYSDFGYGYVDAVSIDVWSNSTWQEIHNGSILDNQWDEIEFTGRNVTAARYRYHYYTTGANFWLMEFQLYNTTEVKDFPSVTTRNATSVEEDRAIMHGTVADDGGESCSVRFIYGNSSCCENSTEWQSMKSTGDTFTAIVTNLEENITYQFKAQINNSAGIANGSMLNFSTGEPAAYGWVSTTGYRDPYSEWTDEPNAFDDETSTKTKSWHDLNDPDGLYSFPLYLNRSSVPTNKLRFMAKAVEIPLVNISIYRNNLWETVFSGSFNDQEWKNVSFPGGFVTEAKLIFKISGTGIGTFWELYELDFWKIQDETSPVINTINVTPGVVRAGENITIETNITDDIYVDTALIEFNGTNYSMTRGIMPANLSIAIKPDYVGSYEPNTAILKETEHMAGKSVAYALLYPNNNFTAIIPVQQNLGTINNVTLNARIHTVTEGNGANLNIHWARNATLQGTKHNFSGTLGQTTTHTFDVTGERSWTWEDLENIEIHIEHLNGTSNVKIEESWFEIDHSKNLLTDSWTFSHNTTGFSEDVHQFTVWANDTQENSVSQDSNFTVNTNVTIAEVVENSTEDPQNVTFEILDANLSVVYNKTDVFHEMSVEQGNYTLKIKPLNHSVDEISINNMSVVENIIELIDLDLSPTNDSFTQIFAINPETEFDNATVLVTAKENSTALYKCENWNFTTQTCMETCTVDEDNESECQVNWVFLQDVVEGEEYNFSMNSSDPAFAESSEAIDVALAVLDQEKFVVAWVDKDEKDISFKIIHTNGTVLVDTVDVDTYTSCTGRVSITTINATEFALVYYDSADKDVKRAIYNSNGTQILAPTVVDAYVKHNSDVSVTEMGDRFAVCYANDADNDADFKIYNNAGAELVGETYVDSNMQPGANRENLIECSAVNGTRFVYFWFDDKSNDNDASYAIVDGGGNIITAETDIDSDVGEKAQVAVTSLDNEKFAMVWFDDTDNDITIAIRDLDNNVILAPTDIENENNGVQIRVAIAPVRENGTSSSDSFVVTWWEQNTFNIKAAVYNGTGSEITAPFAVDTQADQAYRLIDVAGKDPISRENICPGSFIVAYTNQSNMAVYKTMYINGSEWDGDCLLDIIAPNVTLVNPENNTAYVDETITFEYNVTDNSSISSCDLILDSVVNQTNTTIIANISNYFYLNSSTVSDGTHAWQINCTDIYNNVGTSEEWQFIKNSTYVTLTEFINNAYGLGAQSYIELILESDMSKKYNKSRDEHSVNIPPGVYTIYIYPEINLAANITIEHFNINHDIDQIIDIDTPEEEDTPPPIGYNFNEILVINPQQEYTGEVTVLATGSKIHKCLNWDYEWQVCLGEWVEIMNTTPGQYYTISFNSTDPAYGESSDVLTLKTIDIDGDLDDWAIVLANPNNYVIDGTQGIDDADTGQTADRDLRRYAFTWDEDYLYSYFRRTASGSRQVSMLLYVDIDNDGLLENSDYVIQYLWQRKGNWKSTRYNYTAFNVSGDAITGDGVDEPGGVDEGTALVMESGITGSDNDNIELETRINWSYLGLDAGSPIQVHVSAARGSATNIPDQVEDNIGAVNTLIADVEITPNREGSGNNGQTVYYNHTITNTGNSNDTIDVITAGTTVGFTVNLTYVNGTALTDTNNDSKVDVGVLEPDESVNITLAITISSASNGDVDETYVIAISSVDAGQTGNVKDRTTIGDIVIYPERGGRIINGSTIIFNHTVVTNLAGSNVVNINATSNNSFVVNVTYANGTYLTDTNSDGLIDVGNISQGTNVPIRVRVQIPGSANYGDKDITTVQAKAQSITVSITDMTTVTQPIVIIPDREGIVPVVGQIFYDHIVINSLNTSDVGELAYDSSRDWIVELYDQDRITLLNDSNSNGFNDTGNIAPFGERKYISANIHVEPPLVADDAFDQTNITANSSLMPLYWDYVTDNTTARILLTYEDAGFTSFSELFNRSQTVYAKAYGLTAYNNVYFRWYDSNGTLIRQSSLIAVDAEDEADDTLVLNSSLPVGTYTVYLHNQGGAEITHEMFYVYDPPNITVTTPNGGEYWRANRTIFYNVSDLTEKNVTILIQYSSNGGTSYTNITEVQLNATPYNVSLDNFTNETFYKVEGQFNHTWDTTTISDGIQYLIRVIGDNTYFSGSDASDAVFTIDNTAPNVSLNYPPADHINDSSPVNITFNCSVTDNINLTNISLYLTNITNASFALNQTTNITGSSNSAAWTLELVAGYYTWNCLAYDKAGNHDWDINRTLSVSPEDNTPPYFNYTYPDGDEFNQSDNVTIAACVSENATVTANITWDATAQFVNLTYNGTEWCYTYTFTNTTYIGDYNITFNATDLYNNSNKTTTNFTVIDIINPTISWVNTTPDPNDPGNIELFEANVTDNDAVNSVWVILSMGTANTSDDTTIYLSYNATTLIWSGTYNLSANARAGLWNATYYANDTSGNNATPYYDNLTVNALLSISLTDAPINFTSVQPGQTKNATPGQGFPLNVTNDGNIEVDISIQGTNLTGQANNSYKISVTNVRWDTSSSMITSFPLSANYEVVDTDIGILQSLLIYFQLVTPSSHIRVQDYVGYVYLNATQS